MITFATSDDVRRVFGGFFEKLAAAGGTHAFEGTILAYECTQPPATIVLDVTVSPARVYVDDARAPAAHVTLRADAPTFDRLLSGALDPMLAMMTGRVKVAGDTSLAMRFLPAMHGTIRAYEEYRAAQ